MALVYENMPSKEKKLKQIAKVENMLSNRSHKPVIKDPRNNEIYLDRNAWNYSPTTSRYRNFFLQEDTKTTFKKIKEKVYILEDLN